MSKRLALFVVAIAVAAQPAAQRHITRGRAQTVVENLYRCQVEVANHRVSAVGRITATDGTVLTVPAETAFQTNPTPLARDLYNECTRHTANDPATVPIIDVDPGGELITAYIVADN